MQRTTAKPRARTRCHQQQAGGDHQQWRVMLRTLGNVGKSPATLVVVLPRFPLLRPPCAICQEGLNVSDSRIPEPLRRDSENLCPRESDGSATFVCWSRSC